MAENIMSVLSVFGDMATGNAIEGFSKVGGLGGGGQMSANPPERSPSSFSNTEGLGASQGTFQSSRTSQNTESRSRAFASRFSPPEEQSNVENNLPPVTTTTPDVMTIEDVPEFGVTNSIPMRRIIQPLPPENPSYHEDTHKEVKSETKPKKESLPFNFFEKDMKRLDADYNAFLILFIASIIVSL